MQLPMSSKSIIHVKSYNTHGRKFNTVRMNDLFIERNNKTQTQITDPDREMVPITSINNTTLNWKIVETEKLNAKIDLGKIDLSERYTVELKKHLITKKFLHPNHQFKKRKVEDPLKTETKNNNTNSIMSKVNNFKHTFFSKQQEGKENVSNKKEYIPIIKNAIEEEKERKREKSFEKNKDFGTNVKILNKSNNFLINKQEELEYTQTSSHKEKKHKEMETRLLGMIYI